MTTTTQSKRATNTVSTNTHKRNSAIRSNATIAPKSSIQAAPRSFTEKQLAEMRRLKALGMSMTAIQLMMQDKLQKEIPYYDVWKAVRTRSK